MTAPSPRLRTAWRVGSALAAAAGSAVVTSALVDRSRSRSQRKKSGGQTEGAGVPLEGPTPVPVAEPASAPAQTPAAAPAAPTRTPSDDLARAIQAADAVEAAPATWARAASEMRAQTTAADTGWAPSTAALAGVAEPLVARPAPPLPPAGPETPPGLPAVKASAAWDYELSGVDTRVPRLPGEPDRRKLRRIRHRDRDRDRVSEPEPEPAAHRTNGAVTEAPTSTATVPPAIAPTAPGTVPDNVAPDRRMLLFIGVAVAVAVLLGAGFVVLGGGEDDAPERAGASPTSQGTAAGGSQPPATPISQLTPDQAFDQAAQRLSAARSFAYQGTSSATDVSPVRPGPWLAVNLTVQGHVQLSTSRLFERGTAADGGVVETTTDGQTIWGRSAASFAVIEEVPVDTVYTLPPPTPAKVGALLLPQWLDAATGATANGVDEQGRATFSATLPAAVLGTIQDDVAPVDATMVLAFDPNGDPVHLEVTTPDGPAALRLVFEIADLGEQAAIPLPGEEPVGTNGGVGTSGAAATPGQEPPSTATP